MTFNKFKRLNPNIVNEYGDDAFRAYCYNKYQTDWLLSHGVTLDEAFLSLISHAQIYDEDETPELVLNDWTGPKGMIYASFWEFANSEYQDKDYMKHWLNAADYVIYIMDVKRHD